MSPNTPVRLLKRSKSSGCAAKIPPQVLAEALRSLPPDPAASNRLLTSSKTNEDAAVLTLPPGKALVQTLDFFPPIVDNPYSFGQIAAANALSDIYAMGGEPWCAMNIVCFPARELPLSVLEDILHGGADKCAEAGAALAGGHSVDDPEIKFGLSVSGLVNPESFATNQGLVPGQILVLTKPLGSGILATAVKAEWDGHEEMEADLIRVASKLNAGPGEVIRQLKLKAATDITGFGLAGHLLEMALASDVAAEISLSALPLHKNAVRCAAEGLLPAGAYSNRRHCLPAAAVDPKADPALADLAFDPQTSGGVLLALLPEQLEAARTILASFGDLAAEVGRVVPKRGDGVRVSLLR